MPCKVRRNIPAIILWMIALVLFAMSCGLAVFAQTASTPPPQQNTPGGALQAQSNLVLVRVIVRDEKGNPVTSLTQNDFKLFDSKKQQVISYFRAEMPGQTGSPVNPANAGVSSAASQTAPAASPQRFTALFVDDYHISFGDLGFLRDAAKKYLENNLDAGARVAIITASGKPELPFTTDRAKLAQALSQLRVNNQFEAGVCPLLPPFLASQAENDVPQMSATPDLQSGLNGLHAVDQSRPLALAMSISVMQGCPVTNGEEMMARIHEIVLQNDLASQETLIGLGHLVHRMSETPGGERTIALISDGFLFKYKQYEMDDLMDAALRANVFINVLDSRGVVAYLPAGGVSGNVPNMYTIGGRGADPALQDSINMMERQSDNVAGETLSEIADGTGGVFVHNTNDMYHGLVKVAGLAPSYLLGFTPAGAKPDGRFHNLQVKLVTPSHFAVQARRGYFDSQGTKVVSPEEAQMEQAVFSQDEIRQLPIQVVASSKKVDAKSSTLSVTVDADMGSVKFVKEGGRNADDVTLFVVLFDLDGNFVAAKRQSIKLRLPDADLKRLRSSGGEMAVAFSTAPGSYLLRAVAGESNAIQLGTATVNVKIP